MRLKRDTVLAGVMSFMLWNCANAADHDDCADLDSLELKVRPGQLVLKDKSDEDFPACMVPGSTFSIEVKASGGADVGVGDVTANEVGGSPLAISGNNEGDKDWLVINVTSNATPGTIVKYEIHVEGIGMLDPRVRVVDVEEQERIQLGVLEETIRNWGIEAAVLEEALRRLQAEY